MRLRIYILFALIFGLCTEVCASNKEDHILLGSYPGSQLKKHSKVDGELVKLMTGFSAKNNGQEAPNYLNLVGTYFKHKYEIAEVSTAKVYKNYLNALQESNATISYQCELAACKSALASEITHHFNGYFRGGFEASKPYVIMASQTVAEKPVLFSLFILESYNGVEVYQVLVEEKPIQKGLIEINTASMKEEIERQRAIVVKPEVHEDDYPLLGRYPGSRLKKHKKEEGARIDFPVNVITENGIQKVVHQNLTGSSFRYIYDIKDVSTFKVYQNYLAALQNSNSNVLFRCNQDTCDVELKKELQRLFPSAYIVGFLTSQPYIILSRQTVADKNIWMAFFTFKLAEYTKLLQVVVEEEKLETGLVNLSAKDIWAQIELRGSASIYGIQFDTDSAQVKPESNEALDQIAKLLNDKKDLTLYVVGHTDDTGNLSHNINLSNERARSVINVLTKKHKIAQGRLLPFGAGPYSPVSTNLSDQGKQKNRRVELVRRIN